MNTIFIVMDSLNRHYLKPYNSDSWVKTPNIERLAARGVVFDKHYAGSLPCMPARREMMTGRYNFLETPWGPIEPWDNCLPNLLRDQKGTYSHMITDHYHYFHTGGNGYYNLFDSWEFERGQEGDVWKPVVRLPEVAAGRGKAVARGAYWRNRSQMDSENDLDYPTPRCFQRAVEFLEINNQEDNWHLHLEVFDPHEPFDCPQKYRDMYDDDWDRGFFTWPSYAKLDPERDDEKTISHIRKSYAGSLTMEDVWLGKLLDKMDEYDIWKDTTVILTTDHGHLLGEHGYWAKNYMYDYQELVNIPLIVAMPGVDGGQHRSGLTATIDLMPTIMDLHDTIPPSSTQGKSFVDLIKEDGDHNDAVLYGYFAKDVSMTDGKYIYTRQPNEGSTVYLHTATPGDFGGVTPEVLSSHDTEVGHFLHSAKGIPHYRIKRKSFRHKDAVEGNLIFDIENDQECKNPINDYELEDKLADKLKELLKRYDAPQCQFTRLGLDH